MLERQLLTIEAAYQMKNQAESFAVFAESMGVVSKSINEVYKTTDLEQTQKNFEHAMMQAETMSQRMDLFLDMTKESLFEQDSRAGEALVTDEEIDQMICVDSGTRKKLTREELDREIARTLGEDHEEEKSKEPSTGSASFHPWLQPTAAGFPGPTYGLAATCNNSSARGVTFRAIQ
jgi:hypothetical protein